MINLIFTIDYEIFGNGEGSLAELVHGPAGRLKAIFDRRNVQFVVFVEAAELEMIDSHGTDDAIGLVRHQVRDFYRSGYEIGLHLHPQWYNGRYENGRWLLDYGEYNLCTQPQERIVQIVHRAIRYLRDLSGAPDFTPLSFRAGNWLFQPSRSLAQVLIEQGIRVDSSVFKGGLQHQHGMDYRPALKHGYYWSFTDDVNIASPAGRLTEFPTYTRMVPTWRLLSAKRVSLQRSSLARSPSLKSRLSRLQDFLHLKHPMKLDFCRMTMEELTNMVGDEIKKDREDPAVYRPIIAIGHTKDLIDFGTVEAFLDYLHGNGIRISAFDEAVRNVHNLGSSPEKGPS